MVGRSCVAGHRGDRLDDRREDVAVETRLMDCDELRGHGWSVAHVWHDEISSSSAARASLRART